MSEAFPKPQPGSQEWHKYLTQRREHGDTRTMCPDTMSEAEKLFGISDRGMSYSVQGNNEGDKASLSPCDYLELQKRQNEDWADYIAQSIPEPTENGRDWHDVLGKLDHALSLDPECAMALGRRAQVYIHKGRISHARADIRKFEEIVGRRGSGACAEIDAYELSKQAERLVNEKQQAERRRHDSRNRRRYRESRSPSRHQGRNRSRDRSHSRSSRSTHRERHRDRSSRRHHRKER